MKLLAAFSLICISTHVGASPLQLDQSKSSITVRFKQMDVPILAKFKKLNASIDYNSAKPELSKASVDVDMRGLELPAPEYNEEVQKKEWFNAPQFPLANFVSTAMKQVAPGKLEVSGVLTIKGRKQNVQFPLIVKTEGKQLSFEGTLTIKRLAFQIGEGEWKDTSMIADDVSIQFKFFAQ
ncbi:MAG: YceI family protein [Burkholderiales bacterium]|nr:YceI family protein [Burkholderiales bacterium]